MPNNEKDMQSIVSVWKLLYGEEYKQIPDINKPENSAYLNIKKKQIADMFRRLMMGPGKILFDRWRDSIRKLNLTLFSIPESELCNCKACQLIREINSRIKLCMEAEQILAEDEIVKKK